MSNEITELEAAEAAIKLANEYRDLQRAEAEKYRQSEVPETEEDFLERVRTVSETSPSGFSAPYVRPPVDFIDPDEETVETLNGEVPLDDVVTEHPVAEKTPELDLTPEAPREDSHDATEIVADDKTSIIDTGFTEPQQVETAQSLATAERDAKLEEEGDKDEAPAVVDHTGESNEDPIPVTVVEDPKSDENASDFGTTKELSYDQKLKAIKEAKTADEVDAIVGDDARKPIQSAATKRKAELA